MTDDYKFQITDDDPISLYNYAKQCQDAGDTDDALIFYNKSITADSTCPHGWYGMSYIYFQQGAYDIAFKKSCQGVKEADYSKYHDPIHFE
jgi:tetratricopeptide (TPR) repeat protein